LQANAKASSPPKRAKPQKESPSVKPQSKSAASSKASQHDKPQKKPRSNSKVALKANPQQIQSPRAKAISKQNAYKTPPSLSDLCGKDTIEQCHKSCYFVSVMLLVSKLKYIYDRLNSKTKDYVDSIRVCPVANADTCQRIPSEIKKKYNVITKGSTIDVNHGGDSLYFLISILFVNNIKFKFQKLEINVNKDITKIEFPKILQKSSLPITLLSLRVNCSDGKILFPYCPKLIEKVISKWNIKVEGGLIRLFNKKDVAVHKRHVIPFTICEGKVLACNWGRCEFSYEKLNLNGHSVSSICLLIQNS
jgi:hypothetical protein